MRPLRRTAARDHFEEGRAVALELRGADARDPRHRVKVVRPPLGHLDQRAVGEDHVGRHPLRLGQRAPLRLQRRQQGRVLLGHHLRRRRPFRRRHRVAAQRHALLALQHRPRRLGHPERAVPLGIGPHEVAPHHLPQDRLPLLRTVGLSHAEGRQPVMAPRAHLLRRPPGQDVDQVPGAEPLARPQHRREGHPDRLGPVEGLRGCVAEVAIATRSGRLAEIAQEPLPPAAQRLGEPQKRVQPPVIGRLALRRRHPLVDLRAPEPDVVGAVEGQRVRRRPVAARPADLLVVAFDRLRQVGMGDPADVGLVHPHAEGDRGADDQPVLDGEAPLHLAPGLRLHAAVIGTGGVAGAEERVRQALGLRPRAAIDDAGLALPGARGLEDLLPRPVLGAEGEMDVRPVESLEEEPRLGAVEEPPDDLLPRLRVRRRGEGGERHPERPAQLPDPEVVGPEIVPPLADAMGLVHGDRGDLRPPQHARRRTEPLRREIEDLQAPRLQPLEDGARLLLAVAAGQRARRHARLPERPHLVAHQRDERRDHERHPLAHQRRQLVAERLAAARRHDREHRLAGGHRLDDLPLAGAESVEAEDVFQEILGGAHRASRTPTGFRRESDRIPTVVFGPGQ